MISTNKIIIVVLVVLLIAGIAVYAGSHDSLQGDPLSPLGEQNGASTVDTSAPISHTVRLGETVSMFGASAEVVSVVEDSRCPVDVQCIWAGTVRVNVHASYGVISKNIILSLGVPYEINGHSVTLTAVLPEQRSTATINPSDYTFTFLLT